MPQNVRSSEDLGTAIRVPIPAKDKSIYGSGAIDDVLLFLSRHPYESFTPGELAESIDFSEMSIRRAVDVLAQNDLVEYKPEGNRKPVQINRSRLSRPDDPVLRIPQEEYHKPVKTACEELTAELSDVIGIVLYGSVARGEADRQSDIDLWVVVNTDRAANQRIANRVENKLEEQRFDGERYALHVVVESVESVPTFTDDIQEIVLGGIPLYKTDSFEKLRNILAHSTNDE
ncbi:nucleotidyltransferase domain-containing protein [Haloarcula sp. JP-L23]|uniref:nucleotidyltransferase domain-containing protein n=1 Tax=Haloarcula sp. JP-L23 TaxID=2716717 RepID=UPI00140ECF20|nr:nucleotidyltransferase [Haloarcula sp. JP-L23]